MHNLDPNDLDAIFREGADSQEYKYNEAAWTDMVARLDQRDRRKKYILLLLAAAIIATVGYGLISFGTQTKGKTDIVLSTKSESTTSHSTTKTTDVVSSIPVQDESDSTVQEVSEIATDISTDKKKVMAYQETPSLSRRIKSVDASTTATANEASDVFDTGYPFTTRTRTVLESETSVNLARTSEPSESWLGTSQRSRSSIAAIDIDALSRRLTFPRRALKNVNGVELSSVPEATKSSRYFFTVYGAPEWSAVKILQQGKQGWRTGATVGIRLSNHFELYTGVGIAKKMYEGGGSDYAMEGGWVDDIMPERMDAKCYIADIPLGITYYTNGRENDGFFVDASLSSYFISSEWYGFDYTNDDIALLAANGSNPIMEVTEENQNRHFVGVSNLSFGYQKNLASGVHIQIAPYMQIPLTGIGSGQVKLHSNGIRLAMKFSL